jgi:hypothetical protein
MGTCRCGRGWCLGCSEGDWMQGRFDASVNNPPLGGAAYESGYKSICPSCKMSKEFCNCAIPDYISSLLKPKER